MAKKKGDKTDKSKSWFIMLEAEMDGEDLTQFTEAITNALRPQSTTIIRQVLESNNQKALTESDGDLDDEDLQFDDLEENEESKPEPGKRVSKSKRTFRSPEVIDDLDLTTDLLYMRKIR